jgi:hypothetical protein
LLEQLPQLLVSTTGRPKTFGELQSGFELATNDDFILFWNNPEMRNLRKMGGDGVVPLKFLLRCSNAGSLW